MHAHHIDNDGGTLQLSILCSGYIQAIVTPPACDGRAGTDLWLTDYQSVTWPGDSARVTGSSSLSVERLDFCWATIAAGGRSVWEDHTERVTFTVCGLNHSLRQMLPTLQISITARVRSADQYWVNNRMLTHRLLYFSLLSMYRVASDDVMNKSKTHDCRFMYLFQEQMGVYKRPIH